MTALKTVTPVALSAVQGWVWGRSRRPGRDALSTWDAKAALEYFGVPFLYFYKNSESESVVPEGILERSGPKNPFGHVFHPENNIFVFVTLGRQRFLVVDGGGGDGKPLIIAATHFFDFAA